PFLIQDALDLVHGGLVPHALLVEAYLLRPWPGNVRQLRASIRAAAQRALLAGRVIVGLTDLSEDAGLALVGPEAPPAAAGPTDEAPRASELDPAQILAALRDAGGNVSRAARALGVHRNQLRRWLAKHPSEAAEALPDES